MIQISKISSEQAYQWMTHKSCLVLDVRNPEEYETVHIKNALLIPMNYILEEAEMIIKDKKQVILVYCEKGLRSEISTFFLSELGYENVFDFGGLDQWIYKALLNHSS